MINKHNAWVIFAMFLFFITKMTALICATIIAIQGNIWIGTLLFLAAIVFRITWTYIPDVEKQEVRDDLKAAGKGVEACHAKEYHDDFAEGGNKFCCWCGERLNADKA